MFSQPTWHQVHVSKEELAFLYLEREPLYPQKLDSTYF